MQTKLLKETIPLVISCQIICHQNTASCRERYRDIKENTKTRSNTIGLNHRNELGGKNAGKNIAKMMARAIIYELRIEQKNKRKKGRGGPETENY